MLRDVKPKFRAYGWETPGEYLQRAPHFLGEIAPAPPFSTDKAPMFDGSSDHLRPLCKPWDGLGPLGFRVNHIFLNFLEIS